MTKSNGGKVLRGSAANEVWRCYRHPKVLKGPGDDNIKNGMGLASA